MNFICELKIAIPQLPCLFTMVKPVSQTFELANSVTSSSVMVFQFVICLFVKNCFSIALLHGSDEW
jgi:hypothetical protein